MQGCVGQCGLRLGQGEPSGHLSPEEGAEWRDEDVFQNLLGSGQEGRLSDVGEQLPPCPAFWGRLSGLALGPLTSEPGSAEGAAGQPEAGMGVCVVPTGVRAAVSWS